MLQLSDFCSLDIISWFTRALAFSFCLQFNPQSSSVSQAGLGIGVQMPGLGNVTPSTLQQQTNSVHPLSNQPTLGSLKESGIFSISSTRSGAYVYFDANSCKTFMILLFWSQQKNTYVWCIYDAELGLAKADEQQQPILPDDPAADSSTISGLGKNLMSDDDLKPPYTIDSPVFFFLGVWIYTNLGVELKCEHTKVINDGDFDTGWSIIWFDNRSDTSGSRHWPLSRPTFTGQSVFW